MMNMNAQVAPMQGTPQPIMMAPQQQQMMMAPQPMMMMALQTSAVTPPYVQMPIANLIKPMFDAQFVQADPKYEALGKLARIIGPYDHVVIRQQIEYLEMCCGCEQQNKYDIESPDGKLLLQANEKSDTCARLCCNPHHSLMVEVSDQTSGSSEEIVFTIERPGMDCCGNCPKPCLGCCACSMACREEVRN